MYHLNRFHKRIKTSSSCLITQGCYEKEGKYTEESNMGNVTLATCWKSLYAVVLVALIGENISCMLTAIILILNAVYEH